MIEKNEDGTYSINERYQKDMWADMELYGCEEYGPSELPREHRYGQAYIDSKKTPCEHCGSIENIHFHHVDKSTKIARVSKLTNRSRQTIQAEIDKCICLCASCHTKHHWATDKRMSNPK